jgi:hypothetical protein
MFEFEIIFTRSPNIDASFCELSTNADGKLASVRAPSEAGGSEWKCVKNLARS